jgi:hypothetical protein
MLQAAEPRVCNNGMVAADDESAGCVSRLLENKISFWIAMHWLAVCPSFGILGQNPEVHAAVLVLHKRRTVLDARRHAAAIMMRVPNNTSI